MINKQIKAMAQHESHKKYEIEIKVDKKDIDHMGHVNNIVYLEWVQEVAIRHWYYAATEDQKNKLLWVITRHEIDYKRSAMEGDVLIVRTWVGKEKNRLFERHTEMIRKKDNKLCAKALSLWTPVDVHTKRPIQPPVDVIEMFSISG